jgi:hypothetical protein
MSTELVDYVLNNEVNKKGPNISGLFQFCY